MIMTLLYLTLYIAEGMKYFSGIVMEIANGFFSFFINSIVLTFTFKYTYSGTRKSLTIIYRLLLYNNTS